MVSFFQSKTAYSTGFSWIYALVSLFGLGIIYIVFAQVLNIYLAPTIISQINNSNSLVDTATQTQVIGGINKYLTFFNTLPFVLFFVIVLYMLVVAWRKEREGEFV